MKRLLMPILLIILWQSAAHAQIKILDEIEKPIEIINSGTVYELRADKLLDGRIKIAFRSDSGDRYQYGQFYLANGSDFKELGTLLKSGFSENKERVVRIDIGESVLEVQFHSMLIGGPKVILHHYYKSNPYSSRSSRYYSKRDIEKLFKPIE